jgi:hypothetical protein
MRGNRRLRHTARVESQLIGERDEFLFHEGKVSQKRLCV